MKKGKPSDPIIDYPEIKTADVSTIKDWLGLCKTANDFYAIKWYSIIYFTFNLINV